MKQKMISRMGILVFASVLIASFKLQNVPVTIYLIGDSTMSVKDTSAYPETGWGMPFVHFFDQTVTVENHAMNGRSTKSFMDEGRWDPVVSQLQPNDWVLIQFGHNDEVPSKVGRYTTPEEFKYNLQKYVQDTRQKGANPVLITPVARRKFEKGELQDTHKEYSQLVRDVAKSEGVPLIDLDAKSQQLLSELGEDKSQFLYLHLEPGQHPNYPDGETDNTHFNELGARMMAQLVLAEMREQEMSLVDRIVQKNR